MGKDLDLVLSGALPALVCSNVLRWCSRCSHQLLELLQDFVSSAHGLQEREGWEQLEDPNNGTKEGRKVGQNLCKD